MATPSQRTKFPIGQDTDNDFKYIEARLKWAGLPESHFIRPSFGHTYIETAGTELSVREGTTLNSWPCLQLVFNNKIIAQVLTNGDITKGVPSHEQIILASTDKQEYLFRNDLPFLPYSVIPSKLLTAYSEGDLSAFKGELALAKTLPQGLLHKAVDDDRLDFCRAILSKCPEEANKPFRGQTPLQAAFTGTGSANPNMIALLLANGADLFRTETHKPGPNSSSWRKTSRRSLIETLVHKGGKFGFVERYAAFLAPLTSKKLYTIDLDDPASLANPTQDQIDEIEDVLNMGLRLLQGHDQKTLSVTVNPIQNDSSKVRLTFAADILVQLSAVPQTLRSSRRQRLFLAAQEAAHNLLFERVAKKLLGDFSPNEVWAEDVFSKTPEISGSNVNLYFDLPLKHAPFLLKNMCAAITDKIEREHVQPFRESLLDAGPTLTRVELAQAAVWVKSSLGSTTAQHITALKQRLPGDSSVSTCFKIHIPDRRTVKPCQEVEALGIGPVLGSYWDFSTGRPYILVKLNHAKLRSRLESSASVVKPTSSATAGKSNPQSAHILKLKALCEKYKAHLGKAASSSAKQGIINGLLSILEVPDSQVALSFFNQAFHDHKDTLMKHRNPLVVRIVKNIAGLLLSLTGIALVAVYAAKGTCKFWQSHGKTLAENIESEQQSLSLQLK